MNIRALLGTGCALILVALCASERGRSQGPNETVADRSIRMSTEAERQGLASPFRGLTANGQITPGLFSIHSTGVSTEGVRKATEAFLKTLTAAQRGATLFSVEGNEWRRWMNQEYYRRQGVSFEEMSDPQREAAFGLLSAALSARGLKQTRDIMRLNHTLGELSDNDFERFGEWRYYLTVMGTPSPKEPWGWQFEGHHAVVNYFVLGDQVVMTPFFSGSEPVISRSGKYQGISVLQEEQDRGLAFVNSLTAEGRKAAVIQSAKTGNNNLTEAFKDNVDLSYSGVAAATLGPRERQNLVDLIALYVDNMSDGQARVKMEEVRTHLDRTWFAWIGGTARDSVFYYRIHSPVILIEFDHLTPTNLRHLSKSPTVPTREHIHVVVRTPNGNDYGKDLLRQHYAEHPHTQ